MEAMLSKLNNIMILQSRSILLFMDNAPCHPYKLKGKFSNIKVEFLPKHTTSGTQPCDAGIIKVFKVKYHHFMVCHIVTRVIPGVTENSIMKSVDVLLAIKWATTAWNEILPETMRKCFEKCGFVPEIMETDDDDPFVSMKNQAFNPWFRKLNQVILQMIT